MGPPGQSADPQTGELVFVWEEVMPWWFGFAPRETASQGRKNIPVVGAIIGAMLGYANGRGFLVTLADMLIVGVVGYAVGWVLMRALPDTRAGKFQHRFSNEVRVSSDGSATLISDYRRLKEGRTYAGAQTFWLSDLASIERRQFAELFPDDMAEFSRRRETAAGRRQQAKYLPVARQAEDVRFVFRNGEETSAGWVEDANAGARLQSELLAFFQDATSAVANSRSHVRRGATLAPNDEPL